MTLHEAGVEAALLPCPFCGQKLHRYLSDEGSRYMHPRWECPARGFECRADDEERLAAWNRRASLPAPQGPAAQVSEPGFVLVPVEPTPEMQSAFWRTYYRIDNGGRDEAYRAMLAAAPQPPSPDTGAQGAEPWKGPGEFKHDYHPDSMAMGDCSICGHTYAAHHPAPAQGAEPVQPVAWRWRWTKDGAWHVGNHPMTAQHGDCQPLYTAQPQASREAREPATIRVCPERDARCPHGLDCQFWIDRGSCDMEGSRRALQRKQTP